MNVAGWIIGLALLWTGIYMLAARYVRWVGRRLTRNVPMWQAAAECRAKALMAERELYMAQDQAMAIAGDCDWWEPCSREDNWTCRVHCGQCLPMGPCLGHDRAWAAEWEQRRRLSL